jgi:hypothetical protein
VINTFVERNPMLKNDVYNLEVEPDTRNHKGSFIQNTTYKLMGVESSGWALICQDNVTCHYVDPVCLREVPIAVNGG